MISVICPSRGRPELAMRMIDSALYTASSQIEIKLYLNDDDPTLETYCNNIDSKYYKIGPDRSPAYSWNLMADDTINDFIFLAGDDVNFVTKNWDQLIINKFNQFDDKIACVYPISPGLSNKKNPHFCLHKNWIKALGYFIPPHFWHWYVDTWTRDVAQKIDRYVVLTDFILEIEKDYADETTKRVHNLCLRERDHYIWQKTNQRWLNADAAALKEFIGNFK